VNKSLATLIAAHSLLELRVIMKLLPPAMTSNCGLR
jgi:hypothetical protein